MFRHPTTRCNTDCECETTCRKIHIHLTWPRKWNTNISILTLGTSLVNTFATMSAVGKYFTCIFPLLRADQTRWYWMCTSALRFTASTCVSRPQWISWTVLVHGDCFMPGLLGSHGFNPQNGFWQAHGHLQSLGCICHDPVTISNPKKNPINLGFSFFF